MDHQSLVGTLLQAGYTVLTGAISWAAVELGLWLKARGASARGWAVLAKLWELAQNYVAHAEQHLRPTFTRVMVDGHLSATEAAELKAAVLASLRQAVSESFTPAELRSALGVSGGGVLDTLLSGLIERALGSQRAAGTLPPAAPAPVATRPF